jgi:hypothetical protein
LKSYRKKKRMKKIERKRRGRQIKKNEEKYEETNKK